MKQGMDINDQNKAGKTPLHIAVNKKNHYIIALLLMNGANYLLQDKDVKSFHLAEFQYSMQMVTMKLFRFSGITKSPLLLHLR